MIQNAEGIFDAEESTSE
ncbi:Protein of unknown function [Bacillus mycoides]|nr:Protein of unknown function [Bacillus mycoides]